jgi:chitin synthase
MTVAMPSVGGSWLYILYRFGKRRDVYATLAMAGVLASYAVSALIFIVKRQWQLVSWMLIYVLGFSIHTIIIPLYAFWHMDDFKWGSTRIVMAEKYGKQFVREDKDDIFDPRSVPLQSWDDYARANNLPGRRTRIVLEL